MPTGYDHTREPDGRSTLQRLIDESLAIGKRIDEAIDHVVGRREDAGDHREPAPQTVERLRQASHQVREAERLIRRALDHDCPESVAAAIAATKRALDHLVNVR